MDLIGQYYFHFKTVVAMRFVADPPNF